MSLCLVPVPWPFLLVALICLGLWVVGVVVVGSFGFGVFLFFGACGLAFCVVALVVIFWVVAGVVVWGLVCVCLVGEFDPGSGRTLAACLTHASRAERPASVGARAANG